MNASVPLRYGGKAVNTKLISLGYVKLNKKANAVFKLASLLLKTE